EDFILAWLMYDDSNIGNILGKKIIVQQLMEKMIKSEVLSSCMATAKAKNNLVAAMQEWIEGSVGGLTVQTESAIKQWVTADINENDLLIDKNTNIKEQIELIKRVVREVDKIIKVEVWGGACFYGEHAWKLMKDIFGTSGIMARCDDIVSNGNFKSGSLLCGAFTPLERAIINKAYAFIKFFINHVARNSDKLEVLNKIKELVVARLDGWGESDLKPFVEHGIVPSTFYSDCMRDQTGSLKTTMLKHWHLFRAKF
nr:hypothetical protein [Burkholderiales bacterium]